MHNERISSIIRLFIIVLSFIVVLGCNDSDNNAPSENTPDNISDGIKRFTQDVEFIAAMPRTSGSEHHSEVQSMCVDRFEELGFEVELHQYGTGTNIIGTKPGRQNPEEQVVVSAHYDSVPGCNGADDNASGVAGLFETARILTAQEHDRTLIVACFDEEEKFGLIGSSAYANREKEKNSDIIISYVYDMIGYKNDTPNSQKIPSNFGLLFPQEIEQLNDNEYRGNFILFLGDNRAINLMNQLDEFATAENLLLITCDFGTGAEAAEMMPDALRSDHAAFLQQGYPAVMITDTAEFRNPSYHCGDGPDNVDTLDAEFAIKVVKTTAGQISVSLMSDQ